MPDSKADLLLHPVRMRILQSLIARTQLTTGQIAELLSDIPQATLYRHLNKLLKSGILTVVKERRSRGTIEKVYAVADGGESIETSDLTETAADEHIALFLKFTASLIGDFNSYVKQDHYHLVEDGVSLSQIHLELNDEEYMEMLTELRSVYHKWQARELEPGRRRRMISTIIIPEGVPNHPLTDKGDNDNG